MTWGSVPGVLFKVGWKRWQVTVSPRQMVQWSKARFVAAWYLWPPPFTLAPSPPHPPPPSSPSPASLPPPPSDFDSSNSSSDIDDDSDTNNTYTLHRLMSNGVNLGRVGHHRGGVARSASGQPFFFCCMARFSHCQPSPFAACPCGWIWSEGGHTWLPAAAADVITRGLVLFFFKIIYLGHLCNQMAEMKLHGRKKFLP